MKATDTAGFDIEKGKYGPKIFMTKNKLRRLYSIT